MHFFKPSVIIVIAFLLNFSQKSDATDFCVTTSAGLEFALAASEANGQSDIIRIAKGFYPAPSGGFDYYSTENFTLIISGGWSEKFGNPCGQQVSPNAFNTTLDGLSTNRIMTLRVDQDSQVRVAHLFFANGFVTGVGERGGGLHIFGSNGYSGKIIIENNAFMNNHSRHGGALSIGGGFRIDVRNNLFSFNHTESSAAVELVINDAFGIYFNNNTIYANTTDSTMPDNAAGLYLSTSGASALMANNLFWDNDNHDIKAFGDYTYLKFNNLESYYGTFDVVSMNIHVLPEFEPGFFGFIPVYNSPLVNGGTQPIQVIPTPFEHGWIIGTKDLYGNPRIQNTQIDIGAVESPHGDLIFIDDFE